MCIKEKKQNNWNETFQIPTEIQFLNLLGWIYKYYYHHPFIWMDTAQGCCGKQISTSNLKIQPETKAAILAVSISYSSVSYTVTKIQKLPCRGYIPLHLLQSISVICIQNGPGKPGYYTGLSSEHHNFFGTCCGWPDPSHTAWIPVQHQHCWESNWTE